MRESVYQAHVISELRRRLPGCFILKNDSSYLQGVPDLLVLYKTWWGMLEVKVSADSVFQPNQEYYLELLDEMSFAACIYPENEYEVLDEIQRQFETRRKARVPKRQQE